MPDQRGGELCAFCHFPMRWLHTGLELMLFCDHCKSWSYPADEGDQLEFPDEEPSEAPKPPRPS
jgi:hypothetical protein